MTAAPIWQRPTPSPQPAPRNTKRFVGWNRSATFNQAGQITVDEEDSDEENPGEGEEGADEELRDPLRILEDERQRLQEIVLRTRRSGHFRHGSECNVSVEEKFLG